MKWPKKPKPTKMPHRFVEYPNVYTLSFADKQDALDLLEPLCSSGPASQQMTAIRLRNLVEEYDPRAAAVQEDKRQTALAEIEDIADALSGDVLRDALAPLSDHNWEDPVQDFVEDRKVQIRQQLTELLKTAAPEVTDEAVDKLLEPLSGLGDAVGEYINEVVAEALKQAEEDVKAALDRAIELTISVRDTLEKG